MWDVFADLFILRDLAEKPDQKTFLCRLREGGRERLDRDLRGRVLEAG